MTDSDTHAPQQAGRTVRRAPGGFPVVGVIGGGQLARMMQPPAVALGVQLSVLAESADSSAALVVPSSPVGEHTDPAAVLAFARDCDVVTFDHEHVPGAILQALLADGVNLQPRPEALVHAQDKSAMRARLDALGLPVPAWTMALDAGQVARFGAQHGWPIVAKTPRGGYDGKGVVIAGQVADLASWLDRVGEPGALENGILLEERVGFVRELAVLVARSPSGQACVWPVVETVQTDGICTQVISPAPGLDERLAARLAGDALRIAGELGVTGVMAVEVFELPDGRYVVNELAMRPHNSGHFSIDGSVTSQFEQHLRAVLDLPLGEVSPRAAWSVMANVLGGDPQVHGDLYRSYLHVMAHDPGVKVHLYGKAVRAGRKIGHVTVTGDDLASLRRRAAHAADFIQGVIDE